ncbi:MAG: DUF4249 family protein [Gemmatimonadaceae bacterium]
MAVALAMVGAVVSCDLGTVTVPSTVPRVVVHSVLNANAPNQVVLVEQSLTGTITVPDTGFNPADPIVTAGGIPIDGAIVEITDPNGVVYHGVEDNLNPANNGKGGGVYRVPINGAQLVLGGRYQLHVATADGGDATASTVIPNPATRMIGGLTRTLNRDHDTLQLRWNPVPGARSYAVRIESPFGPFFFFTDSSAFRVTGDFRNPFASNFERVFIPGFRQEVVVGAVDANFYDYYRTGNDPFTGSGLINRVTGGVGVFGSIVMLNTGTITVTADQTEPIEGRFRLAPGPGTTNAYAAQVTLYVESKAARSGLPDALSGRYFTPSPNSRSDGILGQRTGPNITFALLGSQLAGDTLEWFDGFLSGDTLKGRYMIKGGTAVFVKVP